MRSIWPQKLLLTVWVKNRWATWFQSVVGMIKSFLMKQGILTHGHICLLLSKGHSCDRARRTGERNCKSVWGCIVDANLSVLNLVIIKKGRGRKIFLVSPILLCLIAWGPKELVDSVNFNCSKDDVHQYIVRKPLNKEGKKPRTKVPKTQCLLTPCVLQHKCWHISLKKHHSKKNKEKATAYAELLAKRIKEAKEKL